MNERSLNRQILAIALPSIVSNITVPLLGMVDVAITGHIGDAVYMGAVAVGSMMFSLVYWLFGFLRMGTSGMTSQALGRRDLDGVTRLLVRSVSMALGVAALLLLLQRPLLWLLLLLIQPTADVLPLARTYYYICIWGAPAMLGLYGLSGWFIGMQNTRAPMAVSILQNVVNIVASLALVFGLGMGLRGVAIGTLVAQWAGLLVAVGILARCYGKHLKFESLFEAGTLKGLAPLKFQSSNFKAAIAAISKFKVQSSKFKVDADIFLRTVFLVAVNLAFTSIGARQGATILAVNTMLMQLYLLFSYVMDGFAYAGEAIGGRYYGARNFAAFRLTVRRLFVWGGGMVVAFTAVYALGGGAFLSLLTDDGEVLRAAAPYFPWALAIPLCGVGAFVWDGIFVGITATRSMLLATFVASLSFAAVYFPLAPSLGNHALWAAMLTFLAMRGVVLAVAFSRLCK